MSSALSNGAVILNVDCDMYSNNSESIRDALCFFMDEEKGHEVAYVQFSQISENISKNELYGSSLRVIREVSLSASIVMFPYCSSNVTFGMYWCELIKFSFVMRKVEFPGLDGYGGVLYVGSGCFHRRETLCGKKFNKDEKITFKTNSRYEPERKMQKLDEVKKLASCTYEEKTQWGKQVSFSIAPILYTSLLEMDLRK